MGAEIVEGQPHFVLRKMMRDCVLFLQVFSLENILLLALTTEFLSITQCYMHSWDNKGGSCGSGSRPKGGAVRRIVQAAERADSVRQRLNRMFAFKDLSGQKQVPLVLDPSFTTGYVQIVAQALQLGSLPALRIEFVGLNVSRSMSVRLSEYY